MATTFPVFSEVLMLMTPCPPRFCRRYSSTSDRLPIPFSETTSSFESSRTTTMPTTTSFFFSLSPRTPAETRPSVRASRSLKRIAIPSRLARMISSSPEVIWTSMSSSPSRMLIAFSPTERTFPYAESSVFLMTP